MERRHLMCAFQVTGRSQAQGTLRSNAQARRAALHPICAFAADDPVLRYFNFNGTALSQTYGIINSPIGDTDEFFHSRGLDFCGQYLYVAAEDTIRRFSAKTLTFIDEFDHTTDLGAFSHSIAADATYIVAANAGHSVAVFLEADGSSHATFGASGSGDGEFAVISDVAIHNGEIYIASHVGAGLTTSTYNRVQVFAMDGTFDRKWTVNKNASGADRGPFNMCIAGGKVVCTCWDEVQTFETDGTPIDTWTLPGGSFDAFYSIFARGSKVGITKYGLPPHVYLCTLDGTAVRDFDLAGMTNGPDNIGQWIA